MNRRARGERREWAQTSAFLGGLCGQFLIGSDPNAYGHPEQTGRDLACATGGQLRARDTRSLAVARDDKIYAETGILTLATVPPLGSVARSKLQAAP